MRSLNLHHPTAATGPCRPAQALSTLVQSALALSTLALGLGTTPVALAGVLFENCVTAADGAISCDTRPTGNTLMDDVDARYGLLQQASPGWAEYNPYQGYDEMLGPGG